MPPTGVPPQASGETSPLWVVPFVVAASTVLALGIGLAMATRPGPGEWSAQAGARPADDTSEPAWLTRGRRHYVICAACHGVDGEGLDRRGPSLHGSEWLLGEPEALVHIVLDGFVSHRRSADSGPVYDEEMQGWRQFLDDRQLAGLLSHLRGRWGHEAPPIEPETVAAVRAATAGRTRPWRPDELRPPLEDARALGADAE